MDEGLNKVPASEPTFVAHANRKGLLGTIIFSAFIVITAIYLAALAATTPKFDGSLDVRIFAVIFCMPLLLMIRPIIFSLKRWHRDSPEISINDDEIFVWMWSDEPIHWSNIHHVTSHQVGVTKMVSLTLIDPALNPPRKQPHKLFNLNRDFLNTASEMTKSEITQIALRALSPAAFVSLRTAQAMPDHRDPVLHTANTNASHDDLLAAIQSRTAVSED